MTTHNTIHTLFEAQVQQRPHHTAVTCGHQSLTYGELNKKANQLAYYLKKRGVKPASHVAICMPRSLDLIVAILAILKVGGAYVPLDGSHPEDRLLFILQDNQSPLLVTTALLQAKFERYQGSVLVFEGEEPAIRKQATDNLNLDITPQHLAYIIYTSGSTGTPKGVLVEHGGVVNYCNWFADYSGCRPQQRMDFSSNHVFDMAVTTSIVSLMLGLTLIVCFDDIKKESRQYLRHLATHRVNMIKVTPSYFKVLLHEIKHHFIALPHLKAIILGGEALFSIDCSAWLKLYPKHVLHNEYGPTEATVAAAQYRVSKKNLASLGTKVPIGFSGTNMSCHVLGADHSPLRDGEVGELYIGGVGVARGYLNQPDLTQKQFVMVPLDGVLTRLYKTGDLCTRLPSKLIEYIGRADTQVKIRGFRVELGEIETRLASHPAIDIAVVLAKEMHASEQQLVAYYILKDSHLLASPTDGRETVESPSTVQLRQYLSSSLPEYMIPSLFIKMDHLPLTKNGKLNLSALPVPQFSLNQHFLAPTTALEKEVEKIWSRELGVQPIGLDDDFFELGGHSLSAARVISQMNLAFKREMAVRDLYAAPTIATFIVLLHRAKKIKKKNVRLMKQVHSRTAKFPLSDFQLMLWLSNTFEPQAKKLNVVARKRMLCRLDMVALTHAFNAVLKKHEILLYQVLSFRLSQTLQLQTSFVISEKNLELLSPQAYTETLEESIQQLANHYPWQRDTAMLKVRLFYLKDNTTELQLCMPHLISDDFSMDILLSDLSKFYLLYQTQGRINKVMVDRQYRDYVLSEQHYFQTYMDRDILFWETYLKDACFFAFPKKYIMENSKNKLPSPASGRMVEDEDALVKNHLSYSTYTEIPEQAITLLKKFCSSNHVSIMDGLSAVLTLALFNCCDDDKLNAQPIFINIVKSTRDDPYYDHALGCFLRLEPIKVSVNSRTTLTMLSEQVHQSVQDTQAYQRCSGLVKLGNVSTVRQNSPFIKKSLVHLFIYLYVLIFRIPKLNRKIFAACSRLSLFKRRQHFLINMNVQRNFIDGDIDKKEADLFNCQAKTIDSYPSDLLKMDHIFEACFFRNHEQNQPYLVISSNLKPSFRERIAKEMVRIMADETSI